ncbi:MarR family winged helix-turn-helix transcriptional regulator [Tellurirhabdus rosea]|uniref:MarR family winged helix-turn-helix transcriptional regulator n=1 Tax=Tellurirhabdus rosea TaxID=2674997 RepID=UPI00225C2544|nr:MarR family transcriptional regulator [Tellurirhabdus rosea]
MISQENKNELQHRITGALGQLLVFNINHVSHLIARFTNRELAKLGYDLQMEQMPVLALVYFSGPELPSQQDIANLLQKNKAGIQRSIRTLERDGYLRIVDDANDRRKNLIALTPAGKMAIERILASAVELNKQITDCLTPDENETLMKLLRKVSSVIE